MQFSSLMIVAVALGTDAFSTAVGIGMGGIRAGQIFLISFVVCLFHIFMPLTGLLLGGLFGPSMGAAASVVGAGVLAAIGLSMLWESKLIPRKVSRKIWPDRPGRTSRIRVTWGFWGVLFLAGSVSMDALSVGFGLGVIQVLLWRTVLVMGIVAGLMTAAGLLFGRRLGPLFGERAQLIGGLILLFIAAGMMF